MEGFLEHLGSGLLWIQASKVEYDLKANGGKILIGHISYIGTFGSSAEARCSLGMWQFKRTGLLKNGIAIFEGETKKQIGKFTRKGLGGELIFQNGRRFSIIQNKELTKYVLLLDGQEIIVYDHAIHIEKIAEYLLELPVLIFFLHYIVTMQKIDANANAPF